MPPRFCYVQIAKSARFLFCYVMEKFWPHLHLNLLRHLSTKGKEHGRDAENLSQISPVISPMTLTPLSMAQMNFFAIPYYFKIYDGQILENIQWEGWRERWRERYRSDEGRDKSLETPLIKGLLLKTWERWRQTSNCDIKARLHDFQFGIYCNFTVNSE